MKDNKIDLLVDDKRFVGYSRSKDAVILFTAFERDDNNRFVSDITNALIQMDTMKVNITPENLARQAGYPKAEILLNMGEITQIMDNLGIE